MMVHYTYTTAHIIIHMHTCTHVQYTCSCNTIHSKKYIIIIIIIIIYIYIYKYIFFFFFFFKKALDSVTIPSCLEPSGIPRSDGKRPDGMSLIPWKSGKPLVWDATCPDSLAPSHLNSSSAGPGRVAAEAERLKAQKYRYLNPHYNFVPVAIETLGTFGPSAKSCFKDLGARIKQATFDSSSHFYLLQRIGVAIQNSNYISMTGTLVV